MDLAIQARCDPAVEERGGVPVLAHFVQCMGENWAMAGLNESQEHIAMVRRRHALEILAASLDSWEKSPGKTIKTQYTVVITQQSFKSTWFVVRSAAPGYASCDVTQWPRAATEVRLS